LNSKHIKIKNEIVDAFFMKVDLNQDNKISFEEYDIFVRMVYETEYLPALQRELSNRASSPNSLFGSKSPSSRKK